jgi:hypothetical protein
MLHKTDINSSLSAATESVWFLKRQQRGLTIFKLMNIVAFVGILIIIVLMIPIS